MQIKLFIPIILLFTLTAKAQSIQLPIDPNPKEELYKKAKEEFNQFERQHGRFLQTKNVRMHYIAWGNPSGIPFIWAHGSFTNGYELLHIADNLVKAGMYVITIDYYGHGQTPIPKTEVSLYHVADDIKYMMDHLNIKQAIIGGFSRGGYIASAFYDAYPANVLGLVLEDGGSVATNTYYHKLSPQELESRIKILDENKPTETAYESESEAYAAIYDTSWKGTQFELLSWTKKDTNGKWAISPGLFSLFNISNSSQFLNNILRPTRVPLFAASMAMLEPKVIFRNLTVPMLILDPVSDDDLFPFEEANQALRNQHPDLIDHKIYENTGHNIHYEHPKQFTQDIITFLQKVKTYHHLK